MRHHVYTRLAGFQLAVIPRAPFQIKRYDAPLGVIDITCQSPDGRLFARLTPKDGGYTSQLDQQTPSLYDVLDVEDGPALNDWRLETAVFTCAWPHGFALLSNNFPHDPGPFDLFGNNHEMIYVQRPRHLPGIEEMCAPYQTVRHIEKNGDSEWIELDYTHDGTAWIQRHEIVALPDARYAVTMQAPEAFAEEAAKAAHQLAGSIAPPEHDVPA